MLVNHDRMRLYGCRRVVERISILSRLALELALIGQRTGTAVAKEAIVSNEFNIMPGMTRLDAVYTYGVAIGGVAGAATVKIVHRKGSIGRDLVKALATIYSLFNRVLVIKDLVPYETIML